MNAGLQRIKEEILHKIECGEEDESVLEVLSAEKVQKILSDCLPEFDAEVFGKVSDEIRAYMDSGEVERRKLLNFCLDFTDPTVKSDNADSETVELHSYLKESEVEKLKRFVNSHRTDVSFGEVVSRVMDRHDIKKQSTVYNSVLMRRQDFCPAVDPSRKDVPKRIVWHIIVGLKCSLEEADELLFSAGHFRRKNAFDLIMEYFIVNKNYDIMAINEMLYDFGLKVFSLDKSVKDSDPRKN